MASIETDICAAFKKVSLTSTSTNFSNYSNTTAPSAKTRPGRVAVAQSTLAAIKTGAYTRPETEIPIPIAPVERTVFYHETTPIPGPSSSPKFDTRIFILPLTTLAATAKLLSVLPPPGPNSQPADFRATLLNFASATKPGGGYLTGAQAQEESIARSSNLSASSLESPEGEPFYKLCKSSKDKRGGYYTDAVIYTKGFSILKHDNGMWLEAPLVVDGVTAAAVNAGVVRRRARERDGGNDGGKEAKTKQPKKYIPMDETVEKEIAQAMHTRMTRILTVCLHHGAKNLVLGSFGTGVFQNNVNMVARTWMSLLGRNSDFEGMFERVAFGVLDDEIVKIWNHTASEAGIVVEDL